MALWSSRNNLFCHVSDSLIRWHSQLDYFPSGDKIPWLSQTGSSFKGLACAGLLLRKQDSRYTQQHVSWQIGVPKKKQKKKLPATETFCSFEPRRPHALWPETVINKVVLFHSNLGDKHLPSSISKQLSETASNTRPEVVRKSQGGVLCV